jgi:hypothetical protein
MKEKRKITSLPEIELKSFVPYTDESPVQNDVLAVLFFSLFAVYLQTSKYAV